MTNDKDWYKTHAHGVRTYRKDGTPRKRNAFPGKCELCGAALATGEGAIERWDGRWVVLCVSGFEPAEALWRYRPDGTKIND